MRFGDSGFRLFRGFSAFPFLLVALRPVCRRFWLFCVSAIFPLLFSSFRALSHRRVSQFSRFPCFRCFPVFRRCSTCSRCFLCAFPVVVLFPKSRDGAALSGQQRRGTGQLEGFRSNGPGTDLCKSTSVWGPGFGFT